MNFGDIVQNIMSFFKMIMLFFIMIFCLLFGVVLVVVYDVVSLFKFIFSRKFCLQYLLLLIYNIIFLYG